MNCQECHDYIDAYVDNELDVASDVSSFSRLEKPWGLCSTIRRLDLKSQIPFLEDFNPFFRL
jgi:hypothetical protein